MSYCQEKYCRWALPSLIVKLKHKDSVAQCPHSLAVNIRLHLNGDPDSTACPTMNAIRNDERQCGAERRLGLVKSPEPKNRRPNWPQAEAGHGLVTRQPLTGPCSALPVCANGSCHLHCFWASPRWGMFTPQWPRSNCEGRHTAQKRTMPLLLR